MSSRKELSDVLRSLIREVASNDPQNRKLALIEQLLSSSISDFTALTAAIADYVDWSGTRIRELEAKCAELEGIVGTTTLIQRRPGLSSPNP